MFLHVLLGHQGPEKLKMSLRNQFVTRFLRDFLKTACRNTRKKTVRKGIYVSEMQYVSQKYCTYPSWRPLFTRFLRGFQKSRFRKTRKKRLKRGLSASKIQYVSQKYCTDPSRRPFFTRFLRGFQKLSFGKTRKKRLNKDLCVSKMQYFSQKYCTYPSQSPFFTRILRDFQKQLSEIAKITARANRFLAFLGPRRQIAKITPWRVDFEHFSTQAVK